MNIETPDISDIGIGKANIDISFKGRIVPKIVYVISNICNVYLFYLVLVGLFCSTSGYNKVGIRGFYMEFRRSLLLGAVFMFIMDAVIFVIYGESISFSHRH